MIEELYFIKTLLFPCQWLSLASDGHVKDLLLNQGGAVSTVVCEHCPLSGIEWKSVKRIISGKKVLLVSGIGKVV